MKRFRPKTEKKHSVDNLMRKVASSLVRDFQANLSDITFCSEFECANALLKPMRDVRELVPAIDFSLDVARFKATYQIASIFKRYRFQNDTYSDNELVDMAIKSFDEIQSHLANHDLSSISAKGNKVLDRAARYVAYVLGTYSDERHRAACRFGRRASVGIPLRLACEASRWELPLTGSHEQISWFDSEMSQVDCVQEYWRRQKESDPNRSTYQETSSLTLTLVPKTFKALRGIMPNTTIGSYQSYGLGELIRIALKRKGYNIKTLQNRHRYLAKSASLDKHLVTADLSSASDCITEALVKRLLPNDWFEVLNRHRIKDVVLPDGRCVESKTFCTMGIGYTFPLQTLIFLALLKSIEYFTFHVRGRRTISVYGDDMIYPTRMHKNVLRFFGEFGFLINVDKTYVNENFRESCGGDYFHGVDVRPFQPRNGSANVGYHAYEAILYKCINGLLMRWSEYEIGLTLSFLLSEVKSIVNKPKLVPMDYPDDAGIKCSSDFFYDFIKDVPVAKPKSIGHGLYRFSYLRFKSDLREEVRHDPYLWQCLGRRNSYSSYPDDNSRVVGHLTDYQRIINSAVSVRENISALCYKELKPIKTFRSEMTGRRLRRVSSYVVDNGTGRYIRQSGISGFETRRYRA